MKSLDITTSQFALLVSSYSFTAAPGSLFSGIIIDKFERKKYILIMLILFIVLTFACSIVTSFEMLLIMRIGNGAIGGILSASILTILADVVPDKRRGKATSTVIAAFSIASIAGMPLGLLIASSYGYKTTFLFISIIAILTLVLAVLILPTIFRQDVKSSQLLYRYFSILKNRKYLFAYFLPALASFASYFMIPFLSTFIIKNLGFSEKDLSLMFFFAGFCTITSMKVVGYLCDKYRIDFVYLVIGLVSFIPLLWLTHLETISLIGMILSVCFFQMFIAGRFVPCITMVTKVPSSEDRGAFLSIMHSIRSFTSGGAAFLSGFVVKETLNGSIIGFEKTGYVSIFITLLSFLVMHKVYRSFSLTKSLNLTNF